MGIFKNYNLKRIIDGMDGRVKIFISSDNIDTRIVNECIEHLTVYVTGEVISAGFANNLTKIKKITRNLKGFLNITLESTNGRDFPYIDELFQATELEQQLETFESEEYYNIREKIKEFIESYIEENNLNTGCQNSEPFIYSERIDKKEFRINISRVNKQLIEGDFKDKLEEFIFKKYKELILKKAKEFEEIIEGTRPLLVFKLRNTAKISIYMKDTEKLFQKEANNNYMLKFKTKIELIQKPESPGIEEILNAFVKDFEKRINEVIRIHYGDIPQYILTGTNQTKAISRLQSSLYMIYRLLNEDDEISSFLPV